MRILDEQPKEIPENLQPKVSKYRLDVFNFWKTLRDFLANFESSPAYNRDPLRE